jgi:hypothetical protein
LYARKLKTSAPPARLRTIEAAVAHHFFCPQCGVHVYDRVDAPNSLGRAYVNVSVACIEDVDVDALIAAPVRYCDGLHDDWASTPKETRHL